MVDLHPATIARFLPMRSIALGLVQPFKRLCSAHLKPLRHAPACTCRERSHTGAKAHCGIGICFAARSSPSDPGREQVHRLDRKRTAAFTGLSALDSATAALSRQGAARRLLPATPTRPALKTFVAKTLLVAKAVAQEAINCGLAIGDFVPVQPQDYY